MLTILQGDCRDELKAIPDQSVQMVATSPPYFGLRDYGVKAQIGQEKKPKEFVENLVGVFRQIKRVLKDDGTLWVNLGDSSSGSGKGGNPIDSPHHKQRTNRGSVVGDTARQAACTRRGGDDRNFGLPPKNLMGLPWRLAFALQDDGWYLRADIIWAKPNPMPESVTDRPTRSHEYIFLLSKSARYYYDADAIKEPGISGCDGHGGAESRKSRQQPDGKSAPTGRRNGMRPDKQRGHSRRHNGFNERWDLMSLAEQTSTMRNKRDVWTVAPANYPDAHFATWPEDLVLPMILAGSRIGDTVLDPFAGSFTTCKVAIENGRKAIGCELNPAYIELGKQRCETTLGLPL